MFKSKIKINPLFFIYLALIVMVDSSAYMLIILLTALMHEGAHLAAMKKRRVALKSIAFSPLGIKITPKHPMCYKTEVFVALCGPLANIGIFVILYVLSLWVSLPYFLGQTAVCSFILGFGNLIPILPLDGGRILRGILYMYFPNIAQSVTAVAGAITGTILLLCVFFGVYKSSCSLSVLIIGIYLSASFFAVYKGSRKCLKKK